MTEARLDVQALYAALDTQRQTREMSWRQVAKEAGVSPSTLTRMTQEKRPDVDSFAALVAWLGVPADRFLGQSAPKQTADTLTEISVLLRAKRELSEDSAKHLEQIIRSTYVTLKKLQR
jgi:transcriptional regulator with XRE-family HTH domain